MFNSYLSLSLELASFLNICIFRAKMVVDVNTQEEDLSYEKKSTSGFCGICGEECNCYRTNEITTKCLHLQSNINIYIYI